MVNTEDNDNLLQSADDETADELNLQELLNGAENDLFKTVHDRSDYQETERH